MNTRFVETFILLARMGSVRRVADVMHATPATISMRLKSLENELGAKLLRYEGHLMTLTPQGNRLLKHAEALVRAADLMEASVRDTEHAVSGRVRVGMIETVVHTCLPDIMRLMKEKLPGVELELKVDLTVNLAEEMMAGDLDVVMRVSSPTHPGYASTTDVMDIPVHWVAKADTLPSEDLTQSVLRQQLLTQVRGTQPYLDAVNAIQGLAYREGVSLSELRISAAPSISGQIALLREGVGVALLPGIFVKEDLRRGELVELDLPALPSFKVALWHRLHPDSITTQTAEVLRMAAHSYSLRNEAHWVQAIH